MAFQPIDIAPLTTYGGTRTTSFTTTITASSDQRTFTNNLFPSPSVTVPLQYTTLDPLVDPISTYYPSSLPILIVTEAVVVIVYTANVKPISTGTFIQTLPNQSTATSLPAAKLLMNPGCSSWSCWAPSERIGTSIAIAFFIVGIIGLVWWGFWCKSRPKMGTRDLESGRFTSRQSHASRRSSRSRSSTSLSYTSSASSSRSSRQPQYQSYVRTRSRSRARAYADRGKAVSGHGSQRQHAPRSHSPHNETHVRDFALPAAASLAAVAAIGVVSRNRSLSTTAIPRSSYHNESVSKGRQLKDETREDIADRSRRSLNLDRPRARSQSIPRGGQSKGNSKHFGFGFGISDKWMALLPFVLDVLYRWSEPKGGWDQVRGKGKGLEEKVEDFGHELINPKPGERSRSLHRSQSVDTAYAQLRPPRPGSAANERSWGKDTSQVPRRSIQGGQAKIMNDQDFNLSATAEAGSRKSPSPLLETPVGRSERRRVTRRDARRRRDETVNCGVVTSDTEASTAGDQRQISEEGGRERMGSSFLALGLDGHRTFPFPLPNTTAPATEQMAIAPQHPAAKSQKIPESRVEQEQTQLITPPDSEPH